MDSGSTNTNLKVSCFQIGLPCSGTSNPTYGYFGNFRIWHRTLNSTEINQDMNSLTPNSNQLVGSWNGTLDSSGKLVDQSSNAAAGTFVNSSGAATVLNCPTTAGMLS